MASSTASVDSQSRVEWLSFYLIEPVHVLREGVVIPVAHGAHPGTHPGGGERVGAGQADVLGASARGVDQALAATAGTGAQESTFKGQQRQPLGMQTGRDGPPSDPASEYIRDERDSSRTRPGS